MAVRYSPFAGLRRKEAITHEKTLDRHCATGRAADGDRRCHRESRRPPGERRQRLCVVFCGVGSAFRRWRRRPPVRGTDIRGQRSFHGGAGGGAGGGAVEGSGRPHVEKSVPKGNSPAFRRAEGNGAAGGSLCGLQHPFRRGTVSGGLCHYPDADAAAGRGPCADHRGRPGSGLPQPTGIFGP